MAAIQTQKSRIYAAQKFLEGLGNTDSENNLFFFIAKTLPWTSADATGATDITPPFPIDTVASHIQFWKNMIHFKRLSASDASLVIRRFDWISDLVYQEYDPTIDLFDPTLGLRPFYIMNADLNVYKCLYNNNGGPSFIEPTGSTTNVITTGDQYQWKFMFTVNQADAQKFLTNEWIPVKVLSISDGSSQFSVQAAAVDGAIDVIKVVTGGFGYVEVPAITITGNGTGATATADIKNGQITRVFITDRGTGYTAATATVDQGKVTNILINDASSGYVSIPTISFSGGGGSGAAATCTIVNGSIATITVTNHGSNYTSQPVVHFSTGSATATAIISGGVTLNVIIGPPGGHGSDPVFELGGLSTLVSGQFSFNEGGFTVTNDFRTLGLLLNPKKWQSEAFATAQTATASTTLNLGSSTGSAFSNDEQVTGQTSGAIGFVLDYTNPVLRLVNITGTFLAGETVANNAVSKTGLVRTATGTAQNGGAFQITLAAIDATATNGYNGYTIRIVSGPGAGQQKIISSNALSGSTNVVTVSDDWTVTPTSSSVYAIAHIIYPDFQPNTGYILYAENRKPIQRAEDQIENVKTVIEF